jgi:hypothetical protein
LNALLKAGGGGDAATTVPAGSGAAASGVGEYAAAPAVAPVALASVKGTAT